MESILSSGNSAVAGGMRRVGGRRVVAFFCGILAGWLVVGMAGCGRRDHAQDARNALAEAIVEAITRAGSAPQEVIFMASHHDVLAEDQAKRIERLLVRRGVTAGWEVHKLDSDPMKAQLGAGDAVSAELRSLLRDKGAETLVVFSEWAPSLFPSLSPQSLISVVGFVPDSSIAEKLIADGRLKAAVIPRSAPAPSGKGHIWQQLYEIRP